MTRLLPGFLRIASLVFAAALFVVAVPTIERRGGTFSGDGTFYQAGLGACGGTNSNSDHIAALNRPQWGNPPNPNANPVCNKKASVTGPLGSVVVTIVDLCPECAFGSLDLSPSAFALIANPQAGRVPITWSFVGSGGGGGGGSNPQPKPPAPPKKSPSPTTSPTTSSATSSKSTSTPTPTPTKGNSIVWAFMNGLVVVNPNGNDTPNPSNSVNGSASPTPTTKYK